MKISARKPKHLKSQIKSMKHQHRRWGDSSHQERSQSSLAIQWKSNRRSTKKGWTIISMNWHKRTLFLIHHRLTSDPNRWSRTQMSWANPQNKRRKITKTSCTSFWGWIELKVKGRANITIVFHHGRSFWRIDKKEMLHWIRWIDSREIKKIENQVWAEIRAMNVQNQPRNESTWSQLVISAKPTQETHTAKIARQGNCPPSLLKSKHNCCNPIQNQTCYSKMTNHWTMMNSFPNNHSSKPWTPDSIASHARPLAILFPILLLHMQSLSRIF